VSRVGADKETTDHYQQIARQETYSLGFFLRHLFMSQASREGFATNAVWQAVSFDSIIELTPEYVHSMGETFMSNRERARANEGAWMETVINPLLSMDPLTSQ